jgi:hypothetical protein
MVMDMIRACYRTRMRFFEDSNLEVPVRWYYTRTGAQPFPHYHRFASGNYSDPQLRTGVVSALDWPGVGEVFGAPRTYCPSFPPGDALGTHFCGSPAKFAGHAHFDPTANFRRTPDGLALCCLPEPIIVTIPLSGAEDMGGETFIS